MNIELSGLGDIASRAGNFLRRFHTILFFLIVSVGLAAAILILLSIIQNSSLSTTAGTEAVNSTFDTETIKRIDTLGTNKPSGPESGKRSNPFVEK